MYAFSVYDVLDLFLNLDNLLYGHNVLDGHELLNGLERLTVSICTVVEEFCWF